MCHKQRQGFTLIELTVVMAILTVAVLFFTQVMLASRRLDPVAEESRLAAEAARTRLEEMRALPFEQIFCVYRSGQPNARFDVAGLSPAPGQESVGRIELPELAGALREDIENK
ncbi:MAG: prepilin-type N-terminal cleavage/methylation domain-containing protein, partial [Planctomycetia bacterium]